MAFAEVQPRAGGERPPFGPAKTVSDSTTTTVVMMPRGMSGLTVWTVSGSVAADVVLRQVMQPGGEKGWHAISWYSAGSTAVGSTKSVIAMTSNDPSRDPRTDGRYNPIANHYSRD